MATVTGTLSHIAGQIVPAGTNVELIFKPNKNTVTVDGRLIYTRPASVPVTAGSGVFEIDLQPTVRAIERDYHYTPTIRWQNPDGYAAGHGYTTVDFPDMKVYVPEEGGRIDDLARPGAANPAVWYESTSEPTNPAPNTHWYDPSTGDVQIWS